MSCQLMSNVEAGLKGAKTRIKDTNQRDAVMSLKDYMA